MQGFRPKIIRTGDGRFGKRASGSGVYRNPRSRRNRFPPERFAKQASFAKTSRRCSVSTVRHRRERCRQKSPAPCGGRTLAGIHRYLGRSADSTPTFGASIEWIRGTFAETHLAKRSKRVSLRSSFSASTTVPRTSCSGRTEPVVCFCALLFRLRLRRSPPLGNVRINSTLPPLIRIFG